MWGLIPKSLAGHMWYEIYQKDENGTVSNQQNAGYTSDGVTNEDAKNYAGNPAYSSKEIAITQEQFDTLQKLSQYRKQNDICSMLVNFVKPINSSFYKANLQKMA